MHPSDPHRQLCTGCLHRSASQGSWVHGSVLGEKGCWATGSVRPRGARLGESHYSTTYCLLRLDSTLLLLHTTAAFALAWPRPMVGPCYCPGCCCCCCWPSCCCLCCCFASAYAAYLSALPLHCSTGYLQHTARPMSIPSASRQVAAAAMLLLHCCQGCCATAGRCATTLCRKVCFAK